MLEVVFIFIENASAINYFNLLYRALFESSGCALTRFLPFPLDLILHLNAFASGPWRLPTMSAQFDNRIDGALVQVYV